MSELKFKACRINDVAYVELFEGEKGLALIKRTKARKKEDWNALYENACEESNRLNALLGEASRAESDEIIGKLVETINAVQNEIRWLTTGNGLVCDSVRRAFNLNASQLGDLPEYQNAYLAQHRSKEGV